MLPTELLMFRYNGEELVPKRLKVDKATLETAGEIIGLFDAHRGGRRGELDEQLEVLEREVDLVSIPGSVMVPDFRLVHPDGRSYLLEIVGYWRPEYLKKKFAQVKKALRDDIILAVSERLNLGQAGIKLDDLPAKIV